MHDKIRWISTLQPFHNQSPHQLRTTTVLLDCHAIKSIQFCLGDAEQNIACFQLSMMLHDENVLHFNTFNQYDSLHFNTFI